MTCKFVLVLVPILTLATVFPQAGFADQCGVVEPNQVAFYQHGGYAGTCVVRSLGRYANAKAIGIGNDKISSIKLGPRTQVLICKDNNFKGGCTTYIKSASSLGKMNDKTSSAVIARIPSAEKTSAECRPAANQVAFYQHANYQGACSVRSAGLYANAKSIGMGNDKISSVIIGSGTQVELCKDNNFKGCATYNKSMPSLGKMNDQTSSVRIVRTVPPKIENLAISTADCLKYGGTVGADSTCASGRFCLLNNVNGCVGVKATKKD